MSNPLVAPEQSSTTAFSGVSLLESANDLKSAIESGDWAAVAMGAVGTALDALGMAMDPFGSILAAGVGWLIEHVGPLKEALDALAGDPDAISAQSQTWANIAKELGETSTELQDLVKADLQTWQGEAADAYRLRAQDVSELMGAAQKGCEGASSGVKTAGEVVAAVRSLVRDIIAEVVGHLISWALQVLFTLGIGLTWVVPQVVATVAKTASKIANLTTRMVKALKALIPLLKRADSLFGDASKALKKLDGGSVKPAGKPKDINTTSRSGPGSKDKNETTDTSSADGPPPPRQTEPSPPPPPKNETGGNDVQPGGGGQTNASGTGSRGNPGGGGQGGLRGQGQNPRTQDNTHCEFDPIDVASGQMLLSEVDATFHGALPLVFQRTHFSGYRTGISLGGAWMSTVDQRIEADEHGVSFAAADGTLQRYPLPGPDGWVAAERGPRRPLKRAEDGGYLLDDQERDQLLYFAPGTGASLLSTVFDRNDNGFEIVRSEDGTPRELRHTAGHLIRFETTGRLVTSIFALDGEGSEVELVRYGYSGGNLTSITNPSGQSMRYHYDGAGRIVGWSDRNDEWYRYTYDDAGRVVRTEGSGGFLMGVLEYDTENRITRTTNALGQTTEYHLNEAAQVIREVDPLGNATVSHWDAYDQLISQTDPLGRTTRYRRDEFGNLVGEIRPDGTERVWERNPLGAPLLIQDAPGIVTRCEYDERGNLTKLVEPDGAITRYTYDDLGSVVAVVDATGATTTVVNNAAGLPIAETDPLGGTTHYERDGFGRVTAVTDPLGALERFGYTVDGRLAWHQHADGGLEQWMFDGEGNTRVHTGAAGAVTHGEYTHFDLPSAQILPDGGRVTFTYDQLLRLTAVTNEQGRAWRFEWDAAGNMVREIDFAGAVTTFVYDAAGQPVERIQSDGRRMTFGYDLVGNVVEQTAGGVTTRYEFDAAGRLVAVDDGTTRVHYELDAAGRTLAETVNGRTILSAFDAEGRRVRRTTPSGADSVWEYDAAGLPVAAHLSGQSLRFAHDATGREVRRALGTAATLVQTWTPSSQLASQSLTDRFGATAQQRSYEYRADGALAALRDQHGGSREFALDSLGRVTEVRTPHWSESYRYDSAGNVTEASWPTAEPDVLGKRTLAGPQVTSAGGMRYGHDRHGRAVLRERTLPGGVKLTWRFTWNDDDRLVSVVVPDGSVWRYTYDALGRRVAKEHLTADGRTLLERVDFTWDGQTLAEEARTTTEGVEVTVWDYEADDYRPLAQRQRLARPGQSWVDTRFHAIVADLTGSPAELVDVQGGVARCGPTSVYGAPIGMRAPEVTPLRFPGQYFDAETGLHYNFQRYYDPATARYLSLDPLGLEPGPNPYAYVRNPFVQIDPLGLSPCDGTNPQGSKPKLTINTNVARNPMHQSPGGRIYDQSPGGRWYLEGSPAGRYKNKPMREVAGAKNPKWSHGNMLPLWEGALVKPVPPGLTGPAKTQWMDKHGRYQTLNHDGTPNKIVERKDGIMGHGESAGAFWNRQGHTQKIDVNRERNRQTSSYARIEEKLTSAGTGKGEVNYIHPRPGIGSDKTYTTPGTQGYLGNPGPSYSLAPNGQLPPGSRPVDGMTPSPATSTGSANPFHDPPSPTSPGPPAKRPRTE